MAELKPCPFCGHEAVVYRTTSGVYFCGCTTASDKCICGAGVIRNTKEEAISTWNRRMDDEL